MDQLQREIDDLRALILLNAGDGIDQDELTKDILKKVNDAINHIKTDYNDEEYRKLRFRQLISQVKLDYSSNVAKTTSYPVYPEFKDYPGSFFAGPFGILIPPKLGKELVVTIQANDALKLPRLRTFFSAVVDSSDSGYKVVSGVGRIHQTEVKQFKNVLTHNDDDELLVLKGVNVSYGDEKILEKEVSKYVFTPVGDKIRISHYSSSLDETVTYGEFNNDRFLFLEHKFSSEPGKEKEAMLKLCIHEIKITVPSKASDDVILDRRQTDIVKNDRFIFPSRYCSQMMCNTNRELAGVFIMTDCDNVGSVFNPPNFFSPSSGYLQATAMITSIHFVSQIVISEIEEDINETLEYMDESSIYGQTIATLTQGVVRALTQSVRVEPFKLTKPKENVSAYAYVNYQLGKTKFDWTQTSGPNTTPTLEDDFLPEGRDDWVKDNVGKHGEGMFGELSGVLSDTPIKVDLKITSKGKFRVTVDPLGIVNDIKVDSHDAVVEQDPRPLNVADQQMPFTLSLKSYPGTAVDIKSCEIKYKLQANFGDEDKIYTDSIDDKPEVSITPDGTIVMTWMLPLSKVPSKEIDIDMPHDTEGIHVEEEIFKMATGVAILKVIEHMRLWTPVYVKVEITDVSLEGSYLLAPLDNVAVLVNPYDIYQDSMISINANKIMKLSQELNDLKKRVAIIEEHFKVTPLGVAGQIISGIASFLPMGKVFVVALILGSALSALSYGLSGDIVNMFVNIIFGMFGVMAVGYHARGHITEKATEWFDQLKGRVSAMLKRKEERGIFRAAATRFNSKYSRATADVDKMVSVVNLSEGVGDVHAFGESYVAVCHSPLGAIGKDYTKYIDGNSTITGKVVGTLNKYHLSPTHSDLRIQNCYSVLDGIDALEVRVRGHVGVGSGIGDYDAGSSKFPNGIIDTSGTGIGTKFIFSKREMKESGFGDEVMLRLDPNHPDVTHQMLEDEFIYYFKLAHPADYDPHVVDVIIETQHPWSNEDWEDVYTEGYKIAIKMDIHAPMVPDPKRTAEIDMSPDNLETIIKAYGEEYRQDYFEYDVLRNNCHMTSHALFECITKLTPSEKLPPEFDRAWLQSMNQRLIEGRANYNLNEALQISDIYKLMGTFFASNRLTQPKIHGGEDSFTSRGKGERVKRALCEAAFDLSSLYL